MNKIFLLTFYQLLKMYNSEEVYTFEEGKQSQQNQPSVESHKNQRINNSRPKNIVNPPQKASGISGTYSRIVPKKPLHDFERLYAQNIQLREKIRYLEQDNTKIKTRVSMAQKQKEQLITQICNMDSNISMMKQRRPSQHSFQRNQQKSKKVAFDQNRRILHQYKDQISKLKLQNGRLKKTVKYTQIQELQTQNKSLHEEMARMKQYMQDIINSTQYDEYQRQIQVLNQQLQGEKNAVKNITVQMKKKDQQMDELKNKMKVLATRKSELERKYTRDINSVKGQLHRAKQKQRQIINMQQDKKQYSKNQKVQKSSQCKQCNHVKEENSKLNEKIKQLQLSSVKKQKQITQLKLKIKQSQDLLTQVKKQQKSPKKQQDQNNTKHQENHKADNNQKKVIQQKKKTEKSQKKQKTQQKSPQKNEKVKQKQKQTKVVEDQYNQDEYEQEEQNNRQNHVEQSEDKVDVFHVDLESDRNKQSKVAQSPQNKKPTQENYEQYDQSYHDKGFEEIQKDFKDNESDQQVLFQKQQKPQEKKKSQSVKKQKKQVKQQNELKQKQGMSATKAQKILKQTIKYRLMAQRYSYHDFSRDIKESGSNQFTVEEVIQMLSNEPFFLNQDHLKMVIYGLYQKQELEANDIVRTNTFLKKMRQFIGDFDLQEEDQEEVILRQIQKKLTKKKLLPKFQQEANGTQMSKKGFVKVLKQIGGFTDLEIQQSLAEASILSIDIAHINYQQFYVKLTRSS